MRTLRSIMVAAVLACIPFSVSAQFMMFGGGNRASQDSLRKIAAADYADMLSKVGVKETREGRQPNSQDESKHPNYDELTANPYPFYPEALVTNSVVTTMRAASSKRGSRLFMSTIPPPSLPPSSEAGSGR